MALDDVSPSRVPPEEQFSDDGQDNEVESVDESDICLATKPSVDDGFENLILEPHESHSDRITWENPWEWSLESDKRWPPETRTPEGLGASMSNVDYDQLEVTRKCIKTYQALSREKAEKVLSTWHGPDLHAIPLFDANGDDYRIDFTSRATLYSVYCPTRLEGTDSNAALSFFELSPRLSTGRHSLPLPKHVVHIGNLLVRTKAAGAKPRSKSELSKAPYCNDSTDYTVIVDVGHQDMPLWIVSSRARLDIRAGLKNLTLRPMPIFDGSMATENGDHDIACILPSIRHLSLDPERRQAMYHEACELVRQTRATVDPYEAIVHQKEIKGWFQAEPDRWPIPPAPVSYLGFLWDAVVLVWDSFLLGRD
ncbi:unnamed protein product [Clonostachys rosea f. rosea IK726]|uniref:Uncharacterized protein n=2 Tax=Bionectria ochroleuca TaxID=29856 RepID=A0A0B7K7V3_BIOOC|nr:unnamed protein product [Clonostachys rosea f. rosea IK726]